MKDNRVEMTGELLGVETLYLVSVRLGNVTFTEIQDETTAPLAVGAAVCASCDEYDAVTGVAISSARAAEELYRRCRKVANKMRKEVQCRG